MNLDELPALVKRLEDRASEAAAMQATQHEISAALRDIVTILERMEKAQGLAMLALAQSLQNLKLGDIHIPPATVMPAPPAPIAQQPDADIEFVTGKNGAITGAKVRRKALN
jgi:hypothetical protein